MRVLINGAGVAGPTLAWWLRHHGHAVTLVESAPALRRGGYVIDFWGLGYDIAERMGLIPRIRELGYQVGEVRLVNRAGRRTGGFPASAFSSLAHGRFTSVRRSDLAATIFDALDSQVETIFGDSVARIEDAGSGVRVELASGASRAADLVVGADGLHSRVRQLAFGADTHCEVGLGYHVAAFDVQGYHPRDELTYVSHGIPGRQVSRFSMRGDRTLFLFVFQDRYLPTAPRESEAAQRAAVAKVFADVGWECPRILAAMERADDFYFDRVSQIRLARWASGRTALVGDAAACVSLLAGEGTGLAMVEAYVLAGELSRHGDDVGAACASYEKMLMPFLRRKQASAAKFAGSFAPATAGGIVLRNLATHLLRVPLLASALIGRSMRDDLVLPEYGRSAGPDSPMERMP